MSDTKHCRDCGIDKPLSDFYQYCRRVFPCCKPCAGKRNRAWAAAHPDEVRAYARKCMRKKFAANPEVFRQRIRDNKASGKMRKWMRDFHQRHPEVLRARGAVSRAIKKGVLVRPSTCSECGAIGKIEAHHPDHTKWLEVVWLCRPCHCKTWRWEAKHGGHAGESGRQAEHLQP